MNIRKITLLIAMIIIPVFFALAEGPGGPGTGPNGTGSPSGSGTPVGGAAPMGSGIVLMLLYAGAYGAKKVYNSRKKKD